MNEKVPGDIISLDEWKKRAEKKLEEAASVPPDDKQKIRAVFGEAFEMVAEFKDSLEKYLIPAMETAVQNAAKAAGDEPSDSELYLENKLAAWKEQAEAAKFLLARKDLELNDLTFFLEGLRGRS